MITSSARSGGATYDEIKIYETLIALILIKASRSHSKSHIYLTFIVSPVFVALIFVWMTATFFANLSRGADQVGDSPATALSIWRTGCKIRFEFR